MPDMAGVGRAASSLTETQTAMYFMAVLLVALMVRDLVVSLRGMTTSNRLADTISKLTEVMSSGDAQSMANMAVIQHELAEARHQRDLTKAQSDAIQQELREAREERANIARALREKKS